MHKRWPTFIALPIMVAGVLLLALTVSAAAGHDQASPGAIQALPVVDDFEDGLPAGWFQYGDYGSGTAIATNVVPTDTVPGSTADNHVLEIDYTSAGWGAGTGRNLGGEDWSSYDGMAFWFQGLDSGATFRVVLSDNLNPNLPGDTAERFAYEFVDDSSGWRHINIPWGAFFRDYAYQPPGAPDDGLTLTEMQAYAFALPVGTAGAIYVDDVRLVSFDVVDNFEDGLPAGWFQYGDYGSGTAISTTVIVTDTVPGLPDDNHVLEIDYTSAGWGAGTGRDLGGADWSSAGGLGFWFYGSNSDAMYRVILSDNLNPNLPGDTAERFAYEFYDDFGGWRFISIPWASFFRDYAYQPPGAPDDGLTLTDMQAYAFALPAGTRVTDIDEVTLFGDGVVELKVAFESANTNVTEGDTAVVSVTLNAAAAVPVTVTYATADDTAVADVDYEATSGQLVFAPGSTVETFEVQTIDNSVDDGDRVALLSLSDPVNATLGARSNATLTIVDDELTTSTGKSHIIDDFNDGQLPTGLDPDGLGVGFVTWNATGASVAITTTDSPPAPVPGLGEPNSVLNEALTIGPGQWAGFTHAFSNEAVDEWVPQDWSPYVGFSVWLYGNNTGGTLFVDILDNRNPGSTTDDAERWSVDIPDNFSGWQYFELPWADFHRKDIGNGAPNDGFTLTEVHGYGIGGYGNVDMGSQNYYVDNVGVMLRVTTVDDFNDGQLPSGTDPNGLGVGFVTWNATGASVAITTTDSPPAAVPGLPVPNGVLQEDLTIGPGQWAGFTHAFSNEAVDEWVPQDWSTYEGICLWIYGNNTGGTLFLDILDNRNPGSTTDDAERWSLDIPDNFSGWQFFQFAWSDFHRKDIGNGAPNDGFTLTEVYGYGIGGYGNVDMGSNTYYVDQVSIFGNTGGVVEPLQIEFASSTYEVPEGDTAVITVTLNMTSALPVSINYTTAEGYATPDRDYIPTSGTLVIDPGQLEQTFEVVTLLDYKYKGDQNLMLNLRDPVNADTGFQVQAVLTILETDQPDPAMLDDFQGFYRFEPSGDVNLSITEVMTGTPMAVPGQWTYEDVLTGVYGPAGGSAPSFTRTFPNSQDWTGYNGLSFWYYGSNSGQPITVNVLDNQATTTAQTPPGDWELVWSDEFDNAAGTTPNPNVWSAEIGDGSLNGIPGWGNSELQFYTDNAATDGSGNLTITLDQAEPAQQLLCWYGPCEYTSARLISANKVEAQYGRIESRVLVPDGAAGLWPAFWMLGTNIGEVGWPQSGEIDIMEYVSRNPNEVFGTIHGPGYSGGAAFGDTYTLQQPVAENYHTFAVEWSPDEIHWFVDGINYHNATPADVAPNEWVFNHPFYVILNLAVGGNFGGTVSPDLTLPQQMQVDYVRVYQAPNTSERFEASFVDDFSGWRQVSVPFSSFTRSAQQPAGAPNDGFGLNDVWGYGVTLPANSSGTLHMDQVQLAQIPTVERSRRFNVDRDTFINGTQPGAYNGTSQTMWVGFFDQMRPVVHVPISGIPNDAEIDLAYLYLYVTEGRGFSMWSGSVIPSVQAHPITTPWMPDPVNWWTPWNFPGGDYGPAVGSNHLGSGKIGTWLRLDITSAVQNTVSTGVNYGYILTSDDNHGVRYGLSTQDYWDPSKTGYVRVYYRTVD